MILNLLGVLGICNIMCSHTDTFDSFLTALMAAMGDPPPKPCSCCDCPLSPSQVGGIRSSKQYIHTYIHTYIHSCCLFLLLLRFLTNNSQPVESSGFRVSTYMYRLCMYVCMYVCICMQQIQTTCMYVCICNECLQLVSCCRLFVSTKSDVISLSTCTDFLFKGGEQRERERFFYYQVGRLGQ